MVQPVANLKNIDDDEAMAWQAKTPGFSIADVWARTDPKVGPNDERRYVDIQAYKLENGAKSDAHFHEKHFELVMVWSGEGLLRYGTSANGDWRVAKPLVLDRFATIAIPPRTLHQFEQAGSVPLVLVTVHALNDNPLTTTVASFGSQADPTPPLVPRSVAKLEHEAGTWEPPGQRARRIRIWGKEARVENDVLQPVDANKGEFHFTLYAFNIDQANPGHFHPASVEFVFALTNTVEFTIRPKYAGSGWHSPSDVQLHQLVPGDMVLVPLAAWHQYVNKSKTDRSMVMALQTPHPIMHTLIYETDGVFDPEKSKEYGGIHV
jgi:mannose-6-phosphate isomerase-like protein (cupin superfamily)